MEELQYVLVGPDYWGPMSRFQADEYSRFQHQIFPCGRCSNELVRVYHNLEGKHRHVTPEEVLQALAERKTNDGNAGHW